MGAELRSNYCRFHIMIIPKPPPARAALSVPTILMNLCTPQYRSPIATPMPAHGRPYQPTPAHTHPRHPTICQPGAKSWELTDPASASSDRSSIRTPYPEPPTNHQDRFDLL